ncbi:nuclear transport factor 2 family protein [Xanthobacter sp. V3C-3]|uniref:YybH family protein n=1 Tax=Xanthobacter lutulentifluminis TaxID=3119935 RepID=UPI00372C24EE
MRRSVAVILCALAAFAATGGAAADTAAERDAAAIRARLAAWTDAFNRGDAATTCELFADDLQSDMQGAPAGHKAAVCARIARALAAPDRRLTYAFEIHDILVSGDLASVRLIWTLTEQHAGTATRTQDIGLDVFRRDPDGAWRIARYVAFPVEGVR